MNYREINSTNPRYLVEQEIARKEAAKTISDRTRARQKRTIALAACTVPFLALGITFGQTAYLAAHRIVGEVGVIFASSPHVAEAKNTGIVRSIYIVGEIGKEQWAESRQLRELGYDVRVLSRRGVDGIAYRVDSVMGSDTFLNYASCCDHLVALSKISGEDK